MALSNLQGADAHIAAHRRDMVARLRLRGASEREIVKGLAAQDHTNPRTGKPWSEGTIHNDLVVLDAEWRLNYLTETDQKKSAVLAETREARRVCWANKDMGGVYTGLKAERELLGLDAPIKTDNVHRYADTPDHDLLAELATIAAAATERARAAISDTAGA